MKRKLALAATVGTLALSPPTPDDDAVREVPPIVQVADVVDYRDARPRLAFRRSAVLGTGAAGAAVARRLAATGREVAVWNRTPARAEALRDEVSAVADSVTACTVGA